MVKKNYGGIMLGKQGSKGTPATRTVSLAYNGSPSFVPVDSKILRMNSRMRQAYQAIPDRAGVSGDFELDVTPAEVGYLCDAFFGSTTSALLEGAAYEHTFKPVSDITTLPWTTVEYINEDLTDSDVAEDCHIGTLGFRYGNQGLLSVSAGWLGIKPKINTSATALSFGDEMPFVYHMDASTLEADSAAKIVSADVSYGNNLDTDDYVAGQRLRDDLTGGEFSVTARVTLKYKDNSWKKKFFGGASEVTPLESGDVYHMSAPFKFKFQGALMEGTSYYELEHIIPDPVITELGDTYDAGGYKHTTLGISGIYDLDGSAGLKDSARVHLQNKVQSYTSW